ncbi:hypothetical protein [Botrimarina mediterranea]|uniref:hypothetical protein n=1 Tax=Botrimarina mediterranea TaxID=2528022 RepID=UPI00118783B1|nr:hypothetical protein K2D_16490 [Planctomycetes bacterium K2D]
MSNRFTETNKWRDSWFVGLSTREKLCWNYLCDVCDAAGVFDIVPLNDYAAFGERIDWDAFIELSGGRVERLSADKLWLVRFIDFQNPRGLKPTNKAHAPIFRSIAKHDLSSRLSKRNLLAFQAAHRAAQDKETEKETDKEKEQEPYPGPLQGVFADWLSYKAERREHYTETGLKQLHGRVRNLESEHGNEAVEAAMRRAMANGWKGFDYDVGKSSAKSPAARTQSANERFMARHSDGEPEVRSGGGQLALRGPRPPVG